MSINPGTEAGSNYCLVNPSPIEPHWQGVISDERTGVLQRTKQRTNYFCF